MDAEGHILVIIQVAALVTALVGVVGNALIIHIHLRFKIIKDMTPLIALLPLAVFDLVRCVAELQVE